jgi:hypothetical protein
MAALACAGGHQIKTYNYAPHLKPPLKVEAGPRQPEVETP